MTSIRSSATASVLLLLGLMALATSAQAGASQDRLTAARQAKAQAAASDEVLDWLDALHRYEALEAHDPTAESSYEIAYAAARLGETDVATERYQVALERGLDAKPTQLAMNYLRAHRGEMGALHIVGPARARVLVRGRWRGELPHDPPFIVRPGTVRVRVSLHGRVAERDLEVTIGETTVLDVNAELDPPPIAVPPPPPPPPPSPAVPIGDPGRTARILGWSLVIGGGVTAGAGSGFVLLADHNLDTERAALARHCEVLINSDACRVPRAGEAEAAHDASNAIGAWNAVRTFGFVAIGTGATVVGFGLLRLLTAPSRPTLVGWSPAIAIDSKGVLFSVRGWL